MRSRAVLTVLLTALVAVSFPLPSRADHEGDGYYEIPALQQWAETQLNVLVIPPNHGQLFTEETGVVNNGDPNELTPFNTYLKAVENAIAAWDEAIDVLGPDWLKEAYDVDVYVLGRDTDIPQEALTDPDILVVTDESEGLSLGTAVRVIPCVVRMSKIEIYSFTYADMYNVTAQEFGHCLGLSHVGSQGGVDPTSEQKHPEHDVMNGFYTHFVGSAGTHLHCISNLDILGLEFVFSHRNPSPLPSGGGSVTIYLPAANFYENQEHFENIAHSYTGLIIAGLAGFVVGQTLNAWSLVLIKERTKEKHLWARLVGSTFIGQLGDTVVFCAIAASVIGITSFGDFVTYTAQGWLYKTLIEVALLPVTYRVIAFIKRREPTYQPVTV